MKRVMSESRKNKNTNTKLFPHSNSRHAIMLEVFFFFLEYSIYLPVYFYVLKRFEFFFNFFFALNYFKNFSVFRSFYSMYFQEKNNHYHNTKRSFNYDDDYFSNYFHL
jgi:hypothetical protein